MQQYLREVKDLKERFLSLIKRCIVWCSKRRWVFEVYYWIGAGAVAWFLIVPDSRLTRSDSLLLVLYCIFFGMPGQFSLEYMFKDLAASFEEQEGT